MIEFNRNEEGAYQLHILATNLKKIRKHLGLSHEDLYGLTQVSVNEISKIEREKTSPRLITLAALAKGLGVDIRDLLTPDLDVSGLTVPS